MYKNNNSPLPVHFHSDVKVSELFDVSRVECSGEANYEEFYPGSYSVDVALADDKSCIDKLKCWPNGFRINISIVDFLRFNLSCIIHLLYYLKGDVKELIEPERYAFYVALVFGPGMDVNTFYEARSNIQGPVMAAINASQNKISRNIIAKVKGKKYNVSYTQGSDLNIDYFQVKDVIVHKVADESANKFISRGIFDFNIFGRFLNTHNSFREDYIDIDDCCSHVHNNNCNGSAFSYVGDTMSCAPEFAAIPQLLIRHNHNIKYYMIDVFNNNTFHTHVKNNKGCFIDVFLSKSRLRKLVQLKFRERTTDFYFDDNDLYVVSIDTETGLCFNDNLSSGKYIYLEGDKIEDMTCSTRICWMESLITCKDEQYCVQNIDALNLFISMSSLRFWNSNIKVTML